jgi:hypothetical protein
MDLSPQRTRGRTAGWTQALRRDHRGNRDPREGDTAAARHARDQGTLDPDRLPLRHPRRGHRGQGRGAHTAGIEFAPWGLAIVKALVLAKFILVGDAMKIGEGHTGPLIWPTLHKAVGFLLLLVILTIIEEAIVGLLHHRSIGNSLGDLFGARLEETLAGYLIMLLVLVPYFAFQVLDDALGKGRLVRMFFIEREPMTPK